MSNEDVNINWYAKKNYLSIKTNFTRVFECYSGSYWAAGSFERKIYIEEVL